MHRHETLYPMVRNSARVVGTAALVSLGSIVAPEPVSAQTDYYNTDKGRPIQVEDAYATERYAFELQLAPLRLERARGGIYRWSVEPELTYGILPRTHLEVGLPLAFMDVGAGQRRSGIAGVDISVLHNLNVETQTFPAFGLVGEVLIPAGSLGPDRTYASAKGIATRTYQWARFHVNAEYTFGTATSTASTSGAAAEVARWLVGMAVDRTYPLKSMLVAAEVYARQPIHPDDDIEWNAGGGVRYQLSPEFSLDAGVGRRLTGPEQSWTLTFGLARAFAVRALMPGR